MHGDAFVTASIVNYFGSFIADQRSLLLEKIVSEMREGNLLSQVFDRPVTELLVSPAKGQEWQLHGLPSDSVSV